MAGSINKVILIGNVGKDPEIRFMPDGLKIANFSVATSESWKDKTTGERKDRTEWHRISVMNDKIAEVVEKYVRRGTKLYIEGQLQSRKWTDQQGVERTTFEVVVGRFKGEVTLLDNKAGNGDDMYSHNDTAFGGSKLPDNTGLGLTPSNNKDSAALADLDDDMPF